VLAWVLRTLPFAVLVLLPARRRIPKAVPDAAKLEGANWLQRLLFVIIPLLWRGLLCAWLLSFVLSIGELGASCLVQRFPTVTMRFFTLIHYQVYADSAGLCLIVLGTTLLPTLALAWLLWGDLRRRYL
jgi:ABC-type Fe3+ transport system permease subunit